MQCLVVVTRSQDTDLTGVVRAYRSTPALRTRLELSVIAPGKLPRARPCSQPHDGDDGAEEAVQPGAFFRASGQCPLREWFFTAYQAPPGRIARARLLRLHVMPARKGQVAAAKAVGAVTLRIPCPILLSGSYTLRENPIVAKAR